MKQQNNSVQQILGLPFFTGTLEEAVEAMQGGGLLVVPAAPALKDLAKHRAYREALLAADMVIPDSGFMVLIWNMIEHSRIPKISGQAYLRLLLKRPEVRTPGNTLWIMASEKSSERNLAWLAEQGISVPPDYVYVAPLYGQQIVDSVLVDRLTRCRPKHVIVTIGGGNQERLGLYLRDTLDYRPSIYCIGAAIAFFSGDQVRIPMWADKLYVGWLFRCLSDPKRCVPRYWSARTLFRLMLKYRSHLPPLESEAC